jgi:hypothetical protein
MLFQKDLKVNKPFFEISGLTALTHFWPADMLSSGRLKIRWQIGENRKNRFQDRPTSSQPELFRGGQIKTSKTMTPTLENWYLFSMTG